MNAKSEVELVNKNAALFLELAAELLEITREEDLVFAPTYNLKLEHFRALDLANQERVLELLGSTIRVAQDCVNHKDGLRNTSKQIWYYLKYTSFRTSLDFLDRIGNEDGAEIYDDRHRLIFCSLNTLGLMSYSLEDLYCRPWVDLFRREPASLHQPIVQLCVDMVAGRYPVTTSIDHIPDNVAEEIHSPERRRLKVSHRFFTPLYEYGKVSGYICVNHLRPEMALNVEEGEPPQLYN